MNYLATFFTHYGAMCFQRYCRENSLPAKMSAVPRSLSASCGVCIRFSAEHPPDLEAHQDMEGCYAITSSEGYMLVWVAEDATAE